MNRTGIEMALRNAVNSAPEIPFEQIAAQPFIQMREHDFITRQEQVKRVSPVRQFTLATAMCLVILVTITGWYVRNKTVDSVITLDVNPSIEILTNQKDEIIAVKAMNADAQKIIGNNDYTHTELNKTISQILNSLVENKYVNREKNAVLLTVTNTNSQKAEGLLKKMDSVIRESLTENNIEPLILSNTINTKKIDDKLAAKYHISRGKLQLIQDMIAFNDSLTLDKLAKLSVEQLLHLAGENHMDLSKYLKLSGQQRKPDITEKPDHDIVKDKKNPSKDMNKTSEQKDDTDIKNNDAKEEIDKQDNTNNQKQEAPDYEKDRKNKEGKKEIQKNKMYNIDKEDTEDRDIKETEKDQDDIEDKNALSEQNEDNSYYIGQGDEDSSDTVDIENDTSGNSHKDLEGDSFKDRENDNSDWDSQDNSLNLQQDNEKE